MLKNRSDTPSRSKFEQDIDLADLIAPTTPAKTTAVGGVRTLDSLESMGVDELLDLRDRIDSLLPATKLSEIDLAEELVLQFQKVKALQAKVLDSNTSAQQKAAVANSCAGALQNLVKTQAELHTAERFKAIENLMIKYLKRLPLDVATQFLEEYEQHGQQ